MQSVFGIKDAGEHFKMSIEFGLCSLPPELSSGFNPPFIERLETDALFNVKLFKFRFFIL
mgnify:CR=1 FL=1